MEVEAGYKKSEAGVIPRDWSVSTIGELAITSSGTTPARSLSERYFKGGWVPWVKTLDLNNSEILETEEQVTQAALSETSLKLYPAGSVLVAMYGGYNQIGRTGLLAMPATVNQAITAIRPDPSKLSSRYLLRVLNYRIAYWKSVASSSRKDPNITGRDVAAFPLAIPPSKAEQEAIAEALSDADALIECLEQLLSKKRDLKQGVMQELLAGGSRLTGFSGDWVVKAVGELGECFAGGTPSTLRAEYWGGEIYWLPSGRVQNCILDRPSEDETCITKRGLAESAAKLIKAHSVLVAITGATCANVACLEFEASANQSVVAIEPISTVNYRFVYYSMLMEREAILSLQSGSAQGGVNLKAVKSIRLRLPPLAEQIAIAAILSDMDDEIVA